jgi:hypothetical protein
MLIGLDEAMNGLLRRYGLCGALVSLKGGLRRVIIRQLRMLGIVGFPTASPSMVCPLPFLVVPLHQYLPWYGNVPWPLFHGV